MRRSAVAILLLVAFAHVSRAQDSNTRHLDASAIGEGALLVEYCEATPVDSTDLAVFCFVTVVS